MIKNIKIWPAWATLFFFGMCIIKLKLKHDLKTVVLIHNSNLLINRDFNLHDNETFTHIKQIIRYWNQSFSPAVTASKTIPTTSLKSEQVVISLHLGKNIFLSYCIIIIFKCLYILIEGVFLS